MYVLVCVDVDHLACVFLTHARVDLLSASNEMVNVTGVRADCAHAGCAVAAAIVTVNATDMRADCAHADCVYARCGLVASTTRPD